MKMDYQNSAIVNVSEQFVGDEPITISVFQEGERSDRAQFGYVVAHNGKPIFTGNDLYGSANGVTPEAAEMASTLAGFLSAGNSDDNLLDGYSDEQRQWLEVHGERLGNFSAERDYEES